MRLLNDGPKAQAVVGLIIIMVNTNNLLTGLVDSTKGDGIIQEEQMSVENDK